MQVVSRGTIDQAVEEFERLRRDCSSVPCGTIAILCTGLVGQPADRWGQGGRNFALQARSCPD